MTALLIEAQITLIKMPIFLLSYLQKELNFFEVKLKSLNLFCVVKVHVYCIITHFCVRA